MRERYALPVAVFMFLQKGEEILLIRRANTEWLDGFYSVPAGALETI
ncbi:MAG TPA: hypothetical protein PLQ36_02205 [Candidatus Gracilibacteria bacterium]|nr:hypothetical protein [Candidatus Gracilibacteria bacterium]